MGIACPHHRSAILKDLYVVDVFAGAELCILLAPYVDYCANFGNRHFGQREVVTWRETDNAAYSAFAFCKQEALVSFVARKLWSVGLQCGKVVFEDISGGVLFCLDASGACVSWAKVAGGIVGERDFV